MSATASKSKLSGLVKRGLVRGPDRVFLYGVEGIGKTTFAVNAPKPLFMAKEEQLEGFDVPRLWPESYSEVLDQLDLVATEAAKEGHQSFVIDLVNYVEPMLIQDVLESEKWSMDDFGEYGRGYPLLVERWASVLARFDRIRESGLIIVLTAHAEVKNFTAPGEESFQRYQPAMSKQGAAKLKQWCDTVMFARHETVLHKKKGERSARTLSTGQRICHTTWDAGWDAKNRCGLPETILLDWDEYTRLRANDGAELVASLKRQVSALLEGVEEAMGEEKRKAAEAHVAKAGEDRVKLTHAIDWMRTKIEEAQTEKEDADG